jgi:hypothetical protein
MTSSQYDIFLEKKAFVLHDTVCVCVCVCGGGGGWNFSYVEIFVCF